jgi:hypothetical protein
MNERRLLAYLGIFFGASLYAFALVALSTPLQSLVLTPAGYVLVFTPLEFWPSLLATSCLVGALVCLLTASGQRLLERSGVSGGWS